MKKTLIILAHNNYDNSLSNKTIINSISEKIDSSDLEVRNLIELYPDYRIDIEAEQKALIEADNIVFQFPFFWYSCPAILKVWIDDVLQHGFAFGSTGDKLVGKNLILSFTIGSGESAYVDEEGNNIINDIILPLKKTAEMIKTNFISPVTSYGMSYIPGVNDKDEVTKKASLHANKLYEIISDL